MVLKSNRRVGILAIVALVAAPAALASSALTWVGHGGGFSLSEPTSLAFLGIALIGLGHTVVRKVGKA
jgi:hypothetical protein